MASNTIAQGPVSTVQWTDDAIQTGFWIDWSKGPISGLTLTLRSDQALMFTAGMVIFIVIVAARCWRIICFMTHQIQSAKGHQDGLYHQQQAILRNSETPYSAIRALLRIGWAWRKAADNSFSRQIVPISLALLDIVGFAAAAIFATRLVVVGDFVLLKSQNCGFPAVLGNTTQPAATGSLESQALAGARQRQNILNGATYVDNCYYGDSKNPACQQFARPNLGSDVTVGGECPFADTTVCDSRSDVIEVTSQLIDSNDDLGINTSPSDRIQYQRRLRCSTVRDTDDTGFSRTRKGNPAVGEDAGETYVDYLFSAKDSGSAATFSLPILSNAARDRNPGYMLVAKQNLASTAKAENSASTFSSDSAIFPWFADVHVFGLSKSVTYSSPMSGWFGPSEASGDGNGTFVSRRPSILACAEDHLFCNGRSNKCGAFGGLNGVGYLSNDTSTGSIKFLLNDDISTTAAQNDTISLIRGAIAQTSLTTMVNTLGSGALLANQQVLYDSSMSAPLAENQTAIEIKRWNNVMLANLQQSVLSRVRGPLPSSDDKTSALQFGAEGETADLCSKQKVRAPGFASIDVLIVSLIFGVGLSILIGSLTLPRMAWILSAWSPFGCVKSKLRQRRDSWGDDAYGRVKSRNLGDLPRREWQDVGLLQLQRQAYEAAGVGTWAPSLHELIEVDDEYRSKAIHRGHGGGAGIVPITARLEKFGMPTEENSARDDLRLHDPAYLQSVVNGVDPQRTVSDELKPVAAHAVTSDFRHSLSHHEKRVSHRLSKQRRQNYQPLTSPLEQPSLRPPPVAATTYSSVNSIARSPPQLPPIQTRFNSSEGLSSLTPATANTPGARIQRVSSAPLSSYYAPLTSPQQQLQRHISYSERAGNTPALPRVLSATGNGAQSNGWQNGRGDVSVDTLRSPTQLGFDFFNAHPGEPYRYGTRQPAPGPSRSSTGETLRTPGGGYSAGGPQRSYSATYRYTRSSSVRRHPSNSDHGSGSEGRGWAAAYAVESWI